MPGNVSKAATAKPDFSAVFAALRSILVPYAPKLKVVHDRPDHYYLDTHTIGRNKRPIMFAAVRVTKNYVSYYLMPIYMADQRGMSPALRKRMQGKACFNFTEVDRTLIKELASVTRQGFQAWKKINWV